MVVHYVRVRDAKCALKGISAKRIASEAAIADRRRERIYRLRLEVSGRLAEERIARAHRRRFRRGPLMRAMQQLSREQERARQHEARVGYLLRAHDTLRQASREWGARAPGGTT